MYLRAPNARPSVLGMLLRNNELVRAMAYRMYRAFTASLSVVVLMLAANETFARSGAAPRGGVSPTHSISRPLIAQSQLRSYLATLGPDLLAGMLAKRDQSNR